MSTAPRIVGSGSAPRRWVAANVFAAAWLACLTVAAASASAQETAPEATPVSVVADLPTLEQALSDLVAGKAPKSVAELRLMQARQQALAKRLIPCTVCIRVGPAQGSGVIISPDGYVLTAAHVAQTSGDSATITLHDGTEVKGKTLGMDRDLDAGMVKIDGQAPGGGPWPYVQMGTSGDIRPGQWTIVTGHPGGFQKGRDPVFRVGRVLSSDRKVIVTDCPLIGGDSGGPLFDFEGNVIGIHSRIGAPLTVNMHVPVNAYAEGWDRLASGAVWGAVPRGSPYIGVEGFGDKNELKGALLADVKAGQPAERAGLRKGDLIVKFNSHELLDYEDLVKQVSRTRPGQRVNLKVKRGEDELDIRLRIGAKGRR